MKKNLSGLTDAEVVASRNEHGANILTPPEREPLWKRFLAKFTDPLIVILLVAGVLSVGISFYEYFGLADSADVFFEPVGIFVAILLATGLAFIFEYKAEKEFEILNQVNDEEPVSVIRNGKTVRIPKKDIVVGDIIYIETGQEIPADCLLLESRTLNVDESSLTGEPVCHKSANPEDNDAEATFPTNEVMRGTKVMEGHGIARVLKVGDSTENGKVMEAAQIDDGVKTPLDEQLGRLSRLISRGSYIVAVLIVFGRLLDYFIDIHGGQFAYTGQFDIVDFTTYLLQTLMIAVTLIVVAVPEGLPMAVTLSLAYSMRRMLKTNNLVRKMHACETMGATTVICTDKTGTLTQNQMHVAEFFTLNGKSTPNVQRSTSNVHERSTFMNMAVNSTAQLNGDEVIGNPTEGALLLWLNDKGIDYRQLRDSANIIAEEPFSTDRKYMTTTIRQDGADVQFVKGAPEKVMDMCHLSASERAEYEKKLLQWQNQAMRTLGFAANGEFQGIAAISDPVREEVPAAVKACIDAGIKIKIVTGDTTGTAKEIGRQTGIWTSADTDRNAITGPEFEALTDDEALRRVGDLKIISRARPMDKKRLVELLQKRGEVVAVTGDGTNDAPALKAAHVGLSMGDGTSVAKEASDITIIDNSFSSIVRAVMWGRSLYQNIQRFILFQMTVNVVACLIVLVGAFFDRQSPLTVTQMLWVNLIMDTFAAMALASLPPSPRVMKDKPRDRHAFIITKSMEWNIIGTGLFFTFLLLCLYFYFERDGRLDAYELSEFFTTFVFLQFWNLFNAKAVRSGHSALHGIRQCRGFLLIVAIIFFGQILIIEFGGEMFSAMPLSLHDWLVIILSTSLVFLIPEAIRRVKNEK